MRLLAGCTAKRKDRIDSIEPRTPNQPSTSTHPFVILVLDSILISLFALASCRGPPNAKPNHAWE